MLLNILLGVQISVFFFFFFFLVKNVFQNKINESIGYHWLLLFSTSWAIFKFHLLRQSMLEASFQLRWKKCSEKSQIILHLLKQPVIRKSNARRWWVQWNIPFEHFQKIFYNFCDMRVNVVMQKNNFFICLLLFQPYFSQCTAQMNQFELGETKPIPITHNVIARF